MRGVTLLPEGPLGIPGAAMVWRLLASAASAASVIQDHGVWGGRQRRLTHAPATPNLRIKFIFSLGCVAWVRCTQLAVSAATRLSRRDERHSDLAPANRIA